jgi:hypothetical protein
MAVDQFLLGALLGKLFAKDSPARRPADFIVTPTVNPPAAPAPATPPATTTPATPGPTTPAALPPAPSFPTEVVVPSPAAPGFKKAIEVWQVNPTLIAQAGTMLVGATADVALTMLEKNFPTGWVAKKTATAEEAATAKSLLASWKDGGVVFMGPGTPAGRRAYRMTKHPKAAGAPAPAPVTSSPGQPTGPTVPASVVTPAPTAVPTTPGAAPAPPPPPPVAAPSAPVLTPEVLPPAGAPQIVTVRPGEGLATIARRLGVPADAVRASELRDLNVPTGPGGVTWEKKPLNDPATGGIKKKNRKGGLQPGDRLFVPPSWGTFDAAQL